MLQLGQEPSHFLFNNTRYVQGNDNNLTQKFKLLALYKQKINRRRKDN